MTQKEIIDKAKQLVMDRKQEVTNMLKQHTANINGYQNETENELSNYDNHPADQGTNLFEREKNKALVNQLERELSDIKAAIVAIENGTYGTCKVCGRKIKQNRLLAIPTTRYCIDHAEDGDNNYRPVEEDVLYASINEESNDLLEDSNTAFEKGDTWKAVGQYGTSNSPSDFHTSKKNYEEMYLNAEDRAGETEPTDQLAIADIEGDNRINREKKKK